MQLKSIKNNPVPALIEKKNIIICTSNYSIITIVSQSHTPEVFSEL